MLMLGTPSIIALMCPSLDRGVFNMSSLSPCKGIHPVGAYVNQQCKLWCHLTQGVVVAWSGCTHTATMLNTLSPLIVLSSTIRRNAMLCLGFSTSPHAPAWERACSSDSITALNWNCDRKQRSCDPHTTWVDISHRSTSLEKCMQLLIAITACN